MDENTNESRNEPTRASATEQVRSFVELLADVTGTAQEKLRQTLDEVRQRGGSAREDVRRNAFRTLFPAEADLLAELDRRLGILEAKLAERDIVAGPRPDSARQTGFASTGSVPDETVTHPG